MKVIYIITFLFLPFHSVFAHTNTETLDNSEITGASYYFSSISGNDGNSGLSSSAPWQSVAKLQQVIKNLKPGDIVYFEKGSSWDNVQLDISNLTGIAASPITFSTYGTGAKPRFRGTKVMNTFSQNGNIWKCIDNDLPDYIATVRRLVPFVYIDDNRYETSRYPDLGYLSTNTEGVNDYLDDYTQNWSGINWKNAMAVVRTVNWEWYTRRITENTATRLNFEAFDRNYERAPTPYLIRNHVNACNNNGEWAQQNDTLWIYYTAGLNTKKVETTVVDTILKISNSQYLHFNDLQIERSVIFNVFVDQSTVFFNNCVFSDAGSYLLLISNYSSVDLSNSSLSYGRSGGIILQKSIGTLTGNTFRRFAFDGADNAEQQYGAYGACILNWYCEDIVNIDRNIFDSVNIAYHLHYSNANNYFTRNVITNFGMTIKDAAAVYVGTDFTLKDKIIRKNIIHNAHNRFVHGIYIDANSNNVTADSNTISNTNIAVYIHVSKNNIISNNNIINPAMDMEFPWNSAIRLDEYAYHHGGEGTPITGNSIKGNNVVLGATSNELAVAFLNLSSLNSNEFSNNKYFNPFGTHEKMFVNGEDYSIWRTYTLSDWKSNTGLETGSSYNQPYWPYSSVSGTGISQQDFVLLLKNPTDKSAVFDLRNYGAYYMDVNGTTYAETVTIPSYYSMILFYKSKNTDVNQAPIISSQNFTLQEKSITTNSVGRVVASDPDAGQKLAYSISGGNSPAVFSIDAATGELMLNSIATDYTSDVTYNLTITVTDNGNPVKSGSAIIKVIILAENQSPVIINQTYTVAEQTPMPVLIGKIVASDPDPGQMLSFSILDGNNESLFLINSQTGELSLTNPSFIALTQNQYILTIRVADNGSPVLQKTAQITINTLPIAKIIYIDPSLDDKTDENGSLSRPYNSWSDVSWKEGFTYLQRSGTTALVDKLSPSANSISIGSYGEGEKPKMISTTNNFVILILDKNQITISNIIISAPKALSCVYSLNSHNIYIEGCTFQNTNGGIRIASGSNITIRYNKFYDVVDGLINYATDINVHYNVFISNTHAVSIINNNSSNQLFNNVFYNNDRGLISGSATVQLYNNIFYLEQITAKAITITDGILESDNNMYYPDQRGFISINDRDIQDITELQQEYQKDLNSFNTDPLFRNILGQDFAIQKGSPAIDAGKPIGIAIDFLGNLVPSGNAPDIGAYELTEPTFNPDAIINQEFHLYPNPAYGEFMVTLKNDKIREGRLVIRSMIGNVVLAEEFVADGNYTFEVSATHKLSKGIYLVEIELEGTVRYTEKLVLY